MILKVSGLQNGIDQLLRFLFADLAATRLYQLFTDGVLLIGSFAGADVLYLYQQ